MDAAPINSPPVSEVETIPMSRKSLAAAIIFCLIITFLAAGGLWLWWEEFSLDLLGKSIVLSDNAAILAAVFAAGSVVGIGYLSFKMIYPSHLVLGKDRFQWITRGNRVWAQIPYRHISQMKLTVDGSGLKIIGINLNHTRDPELIFHKSGSQRENGGWDLQIESGLWAFSIEEIHERLARHVDPSVGEGNVPAES